MVRAKFMCVSVEECLYGGNINLEPVRSSDSPENVLFYKYTPAGEISLKVTKIETMRKFKVGQTYYVDFTPAEEDE